MKAAAVASQPVAALTVAPTVAEIEGRIDTHLGFVRSTPWVHLSNGNYERDLPDLHGSFQLSSPDGVHAEAIDYFSATPRLGRLSLAVAYPIGALVSAAKPQLQDKIQTQLAHTLVASTYVEAFSGLETSFWVQADDAQFDVHARL